MLLKDETAEPKVTGRSAEARQVEPAERARLAEDARGEVSWKLWGPYLSERQWGTVREDYSPVRQCLGVLLARPGALARLSLGRGRHRRDQRPQPAAVPGAGVVERQGPDPEGAAVRPDQRRGQSQRGCQGAVLLSRRHADPLVPEISLQVSAAGIPVQLAGRGKPPARQGPCRVRADRHRRVRRRPLFRRVRRIRQGGPRGRLDAGDGAQPWPRSGASAHPAAAVVPQHLVMARRARTAPTCTPTTARPSRSRASCSAATASTPTASRTLLFCDNDTNVRRLFGVEGVARATSRTPSTSIWSPAGRTP